MPDGPHHPDVVSRVLHVLAGIAVPGIFLLELRPILRAIAWLAGA